MHTVRPEDSLKDSSDLTMAFLMAHTVKHDIAGAADLVCAAGEAAVAMLETLDVGSVIHLCAPWLLRYGTIRKPEALDAAFDRFRDRAAAVPEWRSLVEAVAAA